MEGLDIIARRAGDIMMKKLKTFYATRQKEEDHTLVTDVDVEINRMVVQLLKNSDKYRHITVIGEEESTEYRLSEWGNILAVVDPLDGTFRYRMWLPGWTFCMSIVEDEVPVAGVVYDPVFDRMWLAERGKGCFLNGDRVHVSKEPLSGSLISLMWWKDSVGNLDGVRPLVNAAGANWMNNVAVGICGGLVAEGRVLSASVFGGRSAWETPAMQILVEEAGGLATDIWGNPLMYRQEASDVSRLEKIEGHVISNGVVHEDLLQMIREANPETVDRVVSAEEPAVSSLQNI